MKQIIKKNVILINQTERILIRNHQFITKNQPYLRKSEQL